MLSNASWVVVPERNAFFRIHGDEAYLRCHECGGLWKTTFGDNSTFVRQGDDGFPDEDVQAVMLAVVHLSLAS